ncbi:YcnI family copper-binding membrane protein [Streptomyces litchfieldiae]|uniref:YcnI family protein n=1 Tax=Streptomyces litchfieldiae TaxID=3075543 RepID=A0ABU2ML00_9ACTN|nr:YcnI family protein [Streptomyces sp. DSM 44938]MDT0342058.1 YcnI family protein [Streptomyces sp. DSM 44938]
MNRTRLAVSAAVSAAAVLTLAGPAAAHVTVDPNEAEQGGYTTLNVRVPNERDNASTIGLEIHLDPEHPIASVRTQPVPGWDVEVETAELAEPVEVHGSEITEAPSVIRWTGGEIPPGTFQQFPLSVGPLPEDTDQLFFKAIQTYDNDEVVRWIEEPVEGEAEPEHPAAVLSLAPAEGGGHGGDDAASGDTEETDTTAETTENAASETTADADSDASDTTARVLAGVGIAVGVAGVAFGVLAGRRRTPSSDA